MERERPPYRAYTVCYDNHRQISTVTRTDMEMLIREVDVNWIASGGRQLDDFELAVYKTYLKMVNLEEGFIPDNKQMAEELDVSRNQISRARNSIGQKLGFKKGW